MEDNICEGKVIKINWTKDTQYDWGNGYRKFKDTNSTLNGIYEDEDGTIRHFKNGKLYNENGPAYITKNGYKEYRINNKLHRIDGPAEIYSDEDYDWWINDYYIDNETMNNWLKENDIPLNWKTWTDSDKMLFALHWSDYRE